MIVLPNSFERYLASLRIFVSLSVLKHGLLPKHYKNLKKIYTAEAIYNKNTMQSVDINKLCKNLLTAATTIKPDLKFESYINKNVYINKSLFSLLLLSISKISNLIKIEHKSDHICIFFEAFKTQRIPYLQELGGYTLKLNNKSLALIPVAISNTDSIYQESEFEYIFDKFSVLNIFLSSEEK